jgi:hypothetical protein
MSGRGLGEMELPRKEDYGNHMVDDIDFTIPKYHLREYKASFHRVFEESEAALRAMALDIRYSNLDRGLILAHSGLLDTDAKGYFQVHVYRLSNRTLVRTDAGSYREFIADDMTSMQGAFFVTLGDRLRRPEPPQRPLCPDDYRGDSGFPAPPFKLREPRPFKSASGALAMAGSFPIILYLCGTFIPLDDWWFNWHWLYFLPIVNGGPIFPRIGG